MSQAAVDRHRVPTEGLRLTVRPELRVRSASMPARWSGRCVWEKDLSPGVFGGTREFREGMSVWQL
jgi:hypothetical protein